jgi:hypothetical protein
METGTGTQKHGPSSQREHSRIESQLVNTYINTQKVRGRKSIENDEATAWFNGAKTVLENPKSFGLDIEPVRDIPTLSNFLEDCNEALRRAA